MKNTKTTIIVSCMIYFFQFRVATALLVAGLTLTFVYLGRLSLHPPARIQALFKGARLLIWLYVASWQFIPINAHHTMTMLFKQAMAAKRKTIHYYGAHSIAIRVSSQRCGQNLRGPFLRAILPMTVGTGAQAMADNGEAKGS